MAKRKEKQEKKRGEEETGGEERGEEETRGGGRGGGKEKGEVEVEVVSDLLCMLPVPGPCMSARVVVLVVRGVRWVVVTLGAPIPWPQGGVEGTRSLWYF